MIVGAQKAGTTSLLRYLGMHPSFCIHNQLEMTFFIRDEEYRLGYTKVFDRYFGGCSHNSNIVAKNVGIMYWSKAAERLKHHNPDIHLVAILRHPVDRAYSAYWYARCKGWENLKTFEQALEAESKRLKEDAFKWRHCTYVERSTYYKHINKLLGHFSRDKLHIFLFENFKKDPAYTCRQISKLFNINYDITFDKKTHYNQAVIARSENLARLLSSNKPVKRFIRSLLANTFANSIKRKIQRINESRFIPPEMKSETRIKLIEYFKPYNYQLSKMLDCDLSQWNR